MNSLDPSFQQLSSTRVYPAASSPAPMEVDETTIKVNELPLVKALAPFLPPKASELVQDYCGQGEISVLVDTPSFYLLDTPAGKPDPTAPCSPDTLRFDNRPRVAQREAKENTCWYYAYNTIRHRIGKNSAPELAREREIERYVSSFRKHHTKYFSSLPTFFRECTDDDAEVVATWDKETVSGEILPQWEAKYREEYETTNFASGATLLYDELIAFLKQELHTDFYSYMTEKLAAPEDKINTAFLNRIGKPPQRLFEQAQRSLDPENYQIHFPNCKWENLPADHRGSLLNTYMTLSVAQLYRLQRSRWTPFQPIDALIAELKRAGPHVISLMIDFDFTDPMQLKRTVDGRPLFTWPTIDEENPPRGHMITIIGAEKRRKEGGIIYYIDPSAEECDPTTPRKIYTLSYQELKDRIMNLISSIPNDHKPAPVGYAWTKP